MGTKELISLLKCLGYIPAPQVGSSHLKCVCPHAVPKGERPFIIVIQNERKYDPIIVKEKLKQIRIHGFSKEQIAGCMP